MITFVLTICFVTLVNTAPSKLLESLKEIKSEHKAIVKQVEELKEAQNTFIAEILKDLKKLEEAEVNLVEKAGGENVLKST